MPIRIEKSKDQLKEGVETRRRKLDDREKHMGKVVKEKKELAKVSHELRYPTKEGAAEIKKALAKSAEATNKEFGKQNGELEKIHKKCKEAEGDLKDRTQMANDNAIEAKRAEEKMREATKAKPHLAQAEHAAKKDAEFTKEYEGKQRKRHEKSIERRNELNAKLNSATLKL